MVSRAKLTINTAPFKAIKKVLRDTEKIVREESEKAAAKIAPSILSELQAMPASPDQPIDWTSQRQRIAVMIKLTAQAIERGDFIVGPRGGKVITNIRYVRTGALADSWFWNTKQGKGGSVTQFGTTSSTSKYVQGGLDFRSRKNALVPKQRFLKKWRPAIDIITEGFAAIEEEASKAINDRIGKEITLATKKRTRKTV